MKKLKSNKLQINKTTLSNLQQSKMEKIKGGIPMDANPNWSQGDCTRITRNNCDIPTIGHDDGSGCLSKSDWGWCWCNGI
jgi:hypothetical protein